MADREDGSAGSAAADGGSPNVAQPALDQQRWAHWPYAFERMRAVVDLDSLEGQAVRVLARSMASERLVAFVGAGVSMAYGRMTWRALMTWLYDLVDAQATTGAAAALWSGRAKQLWPSRQDFDDYPDQPMKAQILAAVLALLPDLTGRPDLPAAAVRRSIQPGRFTAGASRDAEMLRVWTALLVGDHLGFSARTLHEWGKAQMGPPRPGTAVPPDLATQLAHVRVAAEALAGDAPATALFGLGPVLTALLDDALLANGSGTASLLSQAVLSALSQSSVEHDSPLRQLALDWGVRRFLTTNYDGEIERALSHLGFEQHHADSSVVHGNQFVKLKFDQHSTGRAVAFAVEGPRRHAAVLHLHGDVDDPQSLVISESHYQRLYLDDHATRDLVSNAAIANYAANPVLFVGSDVSEEDVLRPMRQFMSGAGHRRDRMAVALFATTVDAKQRALRQTALLLRYGVIALYYGADEGAVPVGGQPAPSGDLVEPWLYRFWKMWLGFEKWRSASQDPKQGGAPPDIAWRAALEQLAPPTRPEGIRVQGEGATHQVLDITARFHAVQQFVLASVDASGGFDPTLLSRLALLLEVCRDWVMGVFLSAKLISLRDKWLQQSRDDFKLALPFVRPAEQAPAAASAKGAAVQFRHRVKVDHALLSGRFAEPAQVVIGQASDGGAVLFDDGVAALCEAVAAHWQTSPMAGRRVVVVSSSRGQGKGGQFDRLVMEDANEQRPLLAKLLRALGHYGRDGDWRHDQVLHVNFSFSNELGTIIGQLAALLRRMALARLGPKRLRELGWQARCTDQLEELRRGLECLCLDRHVPTRLLLVLGNAGVLFDAQGRPKNGLIQRVLQLVMSNRFDQAPLDVLMYVGESQVPAGLRLTLPEQRATDNKAARSQVRRPLVQDQRANRRYNRLNLGVPAPAVSRVLLHALPRTRLTWLAGAYFPELSRSLGWTEPVVAAEPQGPQKPLDEWQPGDREARRLYLASGGSRYALTVLLAWLDSQRLAGVEAPASGSAASKPIKARLDGLVSEAIAALEGPPSGASVEIAIEFVLDRWAAMHAVRASLHADVLPKPRTGSVFEAEAAHMCRVQHWLCQPLCPEGWRLATELLWHLGAFSHPVEAEVLLACPGVAASVRPLCALAAAKNVTGPEDDLLMVRAMLELLVHWCLLFRVEARPLPGSLLQARQADAGAPGLPRHQRLRYCPHRHMQRHLLRLMGGRNVESTQWDQFTTTIYASLPDEAPVLRKAAHRTLIEVVQVLTGYPTTQADTTPVDVSAQAMVLEVDRIRAAYYLVRSTYSLGVISHLAPDAHDTDARCGHMEQYRRLVRWITHAARYWERRHGLDLEQQAELSDLGARWSGPDTAPGDSTPLPPMARVQGIFYPSELVWLYNECGVISLAQGKLQDAEHLLTMAELAAKHVESDDSGSLHTRIRLQAALVQIERGRSPRARQLLLPIAQRRQGHPVLPWIATYYLGMIEHLGGSYATARQHYEVALDHLRANGRSRAASFVLIHLADVMRVMRPDQFEEAKSCANEAFSLAQQGGHEDVRIMAMLGSVRLHVEANNHQMHDAFEKLSFAEAYAVRMDIPRLACEVHDLRARYLYNQGEYRLSAQDATAGLEIAALYDMKLRKARGLLTLARILIKRGELAGASGLVKMGRELAAACDYYTCVRGFKELDLTLQRTSGLERHH